MKPRAGLLSEGRKRGRHQRRTRAPAPAEIDSVLSSSVSTSSMALDDDRDESSLMPGDLLRFPRGPLYSHWAVYLGKLEDGRPVVGHLWRPPPPTPEMQSPLGPPNAIATDFGSVSQQDRGKPAFRDGLLQGKMNKVILSPLEEVGDEWHVANTQYDNRFSDPLPREEIVERVCQRIGERSYSLLFHNCEHFATWARYDQTASDQVAFIADLVCGTAAVVVGSAAGVAGSLVGKAASAAIASATVGTATRLARYSKRRQIRRQNSLENEKIAAFATADPVFRIENAQIRRIAGKRPQKAQGAFVGVPSAATAAAATFARKLKDNPIKQKVSRKTASFCTTVSHALSAKVKDKFFSGHQHEQRGTLQAASN